MPPSLILSRPSPDKLESFAGVSLGKSRHYLVAHLDSSDIPKPPGSMAGRGDTDLLVSSESTCFTLHSVCRQVLTDASRSP